MPDFSLIAIGCYTEKMPHVDGNGGGIQIVALDRDTGALSERHVVGGVRNPSYLAISPNGDRLYSVEELGADANPHVVAYALDRKTGELTELGRVPSPGSAACHIYVTQGAKLLLVSNFVSGDLLVYRLDADGVPQAPAQVISRPGDNTARGHCAVEAPGDPSTILFCDAGNDVVAGYAVTPTGLDPKPLFEVAALKGDFPRHVATTPGKSSVLVANELTSHLSIFRLVDRVATKGERISTLPADFTTDSWGAAVRFHPNGRYGYMSTRNHDSIMGVEVDHETLKLKPVGIWKSGGAIPRDFAIDASGKWLVAAHQNSSTLAVHAVDPATGKLTDTGQRFSTGTPVAVLFL